MDAALQTYLCRAAIPGLHRPPIGAAHAPSLGAKLLDARFENATDRAHGNSSIQNGRQLSRRFGRSGQTMTFRTVGTLAAQRGIRLRDRLVCERSASANRLFRGRELPRRSVPEQTWLGYDRSHRSHGSKTLSRSEFAVHRVFSPRMARRAEAILSGRPSRFYRTSARSFWDVLRARQSRQALVARASML
jgi:hypothetical protein